MLRNAGPQGGPGMPEWGMLPIPVKLVKAGVRDMIRISDARMSGTSYGACILHVAPEIAHRRPAGAGADRRPDHARCAGAQDDARGLRRRAGAPPRRAAEAAAPRYERGYGWMFAQHIKQANDGCDFDFLETGFGKPVPEPDIF